MHFLLFLTWPIVLPLKTFKSEGIKTMSSVYLAGLITGYIFAVVATVFTQWLVFLLVATIIGLIWGFWIAEGKEEGTLLGKFISTFAAGFLLAFPVHFILSHLFIGFIFHPFI